jgi:hypothetical protein
MRPARLQVNRRRDMLHQANVASLLFCLVSLGQEEKKERRVPLIDNRRQPLLGRGEHDTPVSPRHLHCLSADEVSRPLLACIIKPVITPVRRATRIACFALLSFWMSFSRLPASLQSAECSTCFANAVLRGPGDWGEHGSAITLCLVTSHARQPTCCLWYPGNFRTARGERGFGWVSAHPPVYTDGTAPACDCLLVTKSDPFEQ